MNETIARNTGSTLEGMYNSNMGATAVLFCCSFFTVVAPMVFQITGFFSPHWLRWNECEAQGLFYFVSTNRTHLCYGDGNYISLPALGLQTTSLVLNILICGSVIATIFFKNEHSDYVGRLLMRIYRWCLILLYPTAGICSILGCCMLFLVVVPYSQYGWSFYLCLVSGILIVLQVFLISFCVCCGDCRYEARLIASVHLQGYEPVTVPEHEGVHHVSGGMTLVQQIQIVISGHLR